MDLSRAAKLISGITVLAVPTIMYGGLTLLGVVTSGEAGLAPSAVELNDTQQALWRAGHAHAGVWVILSLVIQILLDATKLSVFWEWSARLLAPLAAVVFSGGFFGLAFVSAFSTVLWLGLLMMAASLIITGVGLLRNL